MGINVISEQQRSDNWLSQVYFTECGEGCSRVSMSHSLKCNGKNIFIFAIMSVSLC